MSADRVPTTTAPADPQAAEPQPIGAPPAEWLAAQRWFGGKGTDFRPGTTRTTVLPGAAVTLATVHRPPADDHVYQLVSADPARPDTLHLPSTIEVLGRALLGEVSVDGPAGAVSFHRVAGAPASRPSGRPLGAEQTNTSVVLDECEVLKVYRRLLPGESLELEVLRHLARLDFPHVPALTGWFQIDGSDFGATLGVAQRLVTDARDGWELTLERLGHDDRAAHHLTWLRDLGRVVAQLHRALSTPNGDRRFAPAPGGKKLAKDLSRAVAVAAAEVLPRLGAVAPDLADQAPAVAHLATDLAEHLDAGPAIRTHGDLHLGQALLGPDGWMLLDFEGEPARSAAERRRPHSGLRDVAGLLRSFGYATATHARAHGTRPDVGWERAARAAVLDGYLAAMPPELLPPGPVGVSRTLELLELEKVLYEVAYELDNRPDWVAVPAAGLRRFLTLDHGSRP